MSFLSYIYSLIENFHFLRSSVTLMILHWFVIWNTQYAFSLSIVYVFLTRSPTSLLIGQGASEVAAAWESNYCLRMFLRVFFNLLEYFSLLSLSSLYRRHPSLYLYLYLLVWLWFSEYERHFFFFFFGWLLRSECSISVNNNSGLGSLWFMIFWFLHFVYVLNLFCVFFSLNWKNILINFYFNSMEDGILCVCDFVSVNFSSFRMVMVYRESEREGRSCCWVANFEVSSLQCKLKCLLWH